MGIAFEGLLDKPTLFKGVSLASKLSRSGAILRLVGSLALIGLMIGLVISKVEGGSDLTTALIKSGRHFASVGVGIYVFLRPFFSAYSTTSKLWKNLAGQTALSGEISSLGIIFEPSAERPVEISWERIAKYRVTDDLFVLLTADGVLLTFPRAFFTSAEDWSRANQLVKLRVVEAK